MPRISVSEEYLRTHAIPTAQKLRDPHRSLTDVTVRTASLTPSPQPAGVPIVQPEELTFNQNPQIEAESYRSPCHQTGGTLTTLAVLLGSNPQAKKLIAAAMSEVRILNNA